MCIGTMCCAYGLTSRRKFVDYRAVQVCIQCHCQRPGNRCGCHHQHMGCNFALAPQFCPLFHPEAVLLVYHHVPQLFKTHIFLYQCMGANQYVYLAFSQPLFYFLLLACFQRAGKQFGADIHSVKHLLETRIMLAGQYFGRCHEAGLASVVQCNEYGEQCHQGLSASHISLEQSVHLSAGFHVVANLFHHPLLCIGEGERQMLVIKFIEMLAHHTEHPAHRMVLPRHAAVLIVQLMEKQLFKLLAKQRLLPHFHRCRVVHVSQSLVSAHQVKLGNGAGGQCFGQI